MKRKLRLIIIAFGVSFVIMAALSMYSLQQFSSLTSYSNQVDHTNRVITQLYRLESLIKELDIKEQDYMLNRDSDYISSIYRTIGFMPPVIENVEALVKENDIQRKTLIILKSSISLRISDLKDNLNFLDTSRSFAVSTYYHQGRDREAESIKHIGEMLTRESSILQQKFDSKKYYEQIATNTLVYLLLVFGLVTTALFLVMVKELKIRLGYQEELQIKVADLTRSHAELEQIAFAASHDLQEPLRKIRVFGNRLSLLKNEDAAADEAKDIISRINAAAARMQELIDDMVNLTSLIKEDGEKETVDLNHTLKHVLTDMDDKIRSGNAVIHREVLPELTGYPRQFYILLKSLLDNSLKFTREGIEPIIAIRADKTMGDELMHIDRDLASKQFYRITVSDNGIGFDNKFISKMFRIFQRLHNQESEYEGKGIGLAICQRIMVNHKGYIIANGHPDVGATFKLFFPVES
jgi:signal transduction histidine kinase